MLAIEHDWRIRKLIRANLEAVGLEVQEAVNGQHGLQLLGESRPDLILLDLDLTGTDIVRLLRMLRGCVRGRGVPIIAVSTEPPSREIVQLGHVDSYLRKPFAVPALLEAVRRALDGLSANQASRDERRSQPKIQRRRTIDEGNDEGESERGPGG
jgi:DNA-binding response OmpR family regulator